MELVWRAVAGSNPRGAIDPPHMIEMIDTVALEAGDEDPLVDAAAARRAAGGAAAACTCAACPSRPRRRTSPTSSSPYVP